MMLNPVNPPLKLPAAKGTLGLLFYQATFTGAIAVTLKVFEPAPKVVEVKAGNV